MAARDWPRALDDVEGILASDGPRSDLSHYASVCCMNLRRLPEALAYAQSSIMTQPLSAAAWSQLGAVHYMTAAAGPDHYLEAHMCFERARDLAPNAPPAALGLAASCFTLGHYDRALMLFRAAQEEAPYPKARLAEAGLLLLLGRHEEGWEKHEARILMQDGPKASAYAGDLADLKHKTVLVCAEQGQGDCIQFMRYVPILRQYCAKVVVEAYAGLEALVASFTECIVLPAPCPLEGCVRINLMSLPLLLGPVIGWEPVPPLAVPSQFRGPRSGIGICPASVPQVSDDLVYAGAMADRKNPPPEMLGDLAREFGPMRSLMHADLQTADWLETAMVVAGLDLVITVDSAVAHLAASLGVETWVLQRFDHCWRWSDGWYPAARIFRQAQPGDWGSVYRQVRAALCECSNGEMKCVA